MNRPLRVFLCHSSNDKPAVRELYQKLRAETWISPWLDEEELYPGQDWNMEIEKAVEAADAIIVCLTKNSINKEGYVQRELRIVLDFADYKPEGTIYILPVRLEECEPPRRLRAWQYADYFEGQRERALERLLISLKRRADSLGLKMEQLVHKEKKLTPPDIEVKYSAEDDEDNIPSIVSILNDIPSPVATPVIDSSALPWLSDVTRAAQYLTRLTLESSSQAAFITRKNALWAYAGDLSKNMIIEVAQTATRNWDGEKGSDFLRLIRIESTKTEHMLHAIRLTKDIVLALVFDAETPFSTIRFRANQIDTNLRKESKRNYSE
jgi:hypothetical protein